MMGVNTVRTKLLAFALGASFAGVAGAFQASYLGATTSDFFQFSTSILVLIMVILGGIGNIWGVLAGAIVLVYIDKTFLHLARPADRQRRPRFPNPSQFNFLIFGILLVVMMRFRPAGLHPEPPARGRAQRCAASRKRTPRWASMPRPTTSAVAPPGQARRRRDREAEVPWEARTTYDHAAAPGRARTGAIPTTRPARQDPRRDQAVRRPGRGQQRRLRHPAGVDRLAHRAERRGQDDLLQHDHRATTSRPPARSSSTASRSCT